MRLQQLPRNPAMSGTKDELRSRAFSNSSRGIPQPKHCGKTFMSELLTRRWALLSPDTKIHQITLSEMQLQQGGMASVRYTFSNNTQPSLGDMMEKNKQGLSFYVVRDDLLHPLVNGNKARKLDGLLPILEHLLVTDVVTCGGCQSAHTAAIERGLKSHLLLRGEQPEVLTAYNLISTMYGNVTYIPRSIYAKRAEMLERHADFVAGGGSVIQLTDILNTSFASWNSEEVAFAQVEALRSTVTSCGAGKYPRKVIIINEGAGDAIGLLGVIRLVEYLSQTHLFGKEQPIKLVVDAGTGTTAIGLAIGARCLGLPWEVTAVMLADSVEGYKKQEERLISDFKMYCVLHPSDHAFDGLDGGIVHWVERIHRRKFGNVLEGEVEACQQIAKQTGVLVDPIYTLAAWEHATFLCQKTSDRDTKVVVLHTGGTLGMFGLAQRYKSIFQSLRSTNPTSV
ncbi:D-cysteine desulfhydrase 2, mitochondrial-like isoform X2 [Macadamia integrifolia]|uniref:D-cysteine desulfhydrase 2, mitochondrial-like isoform X2 n=1 Tax=Macadamia integrifolia TaxID=60698 RepID=UPI001C4ED6F0|nr:D-cysteine desulfhydrase 2, mitochondrial-like isoform X2 [Macadamia integrifolia]